MVNKVIALNKAEVSSLDSGLSNPIHYRKSGLSLNHIIGCPLDCSYCVRHKDNNWKMKRPHAIAKDHEAVSLLLEHKYFKRDLTPIQLFNKATDSMLPSVKPHLFSVLGLLDKEGLTNHVLIITRYKINKEDCVQFNRIKNLKITILVTYSGIENSRIEPISNAIPIKSLKTAYLNSESYKTILYWRPIIPGFNDSDKQIDFALNELSQFANATVFTGLFYNDVIKKYFDNSGLPELYNQSARRKIFPAELENRILSRSKGTAAENKLFRKTSCGVSFSHGLPDYNGHFGVQDLCEICPEKQYLLCKSNHRVPKEDQVLFNASQININNLKFVFNKDRSIIVEDIDEEDRYFLQHNLQFQVHNSIYPHAIGQHGRADEFKDFKRNS